MTRRTTTLAVFAVLATLALTGCAGLRPGVAAEVGGETITTREVDTFAQGLCTYDASRSGADTNANTRSRALSILVRSALARDFGNRTALEVDQGTVNQQVEAVEAAVTDLPDEDREKFLEHVRESLVGDQYAVEAATARLTSEGQEPSNEALSQTVADLYADWADEAGVEIDPRFGTWAEVEARPGSGSLSVPADDSADPALPGSQTCR